MLNVSWAKKRAEFFFVFAIRERERDRREGREYNRQKDIKQ